MSLEWHVTREGPAFLLGSLPRGGTLVGLEFGDREWQALERYCAQHVDPALTQGRTPRMAQLDIGGLDARRVEAPGGGWFLLQTAPDALPERVPFDTTLLVLWLLAVTY